MTRINKYSIVVTVLEGRNFSLRPGSKVYIQCRFNGEILTTDPVEHSATPIWDTELAWDLESRVLHFLRSQRSTLKLECFSLTGQGRRDTQGYIMLDLRAAQEAPGKEKWMALLNAARGVSGTTGQAAMRPEVKLSFVVGPHGSPNSTPVPPTLIAPGSWARNSPTGSKRNGGIRSAEEKRTHMPIPSPQHQVEQYRQTLVPVQLTDSGYYKVGTASEGLQEYVLSITIAFAEHLHVLAEHTRNEDIAANPKSKNIYGTKIDLEEDSPRRYYFYYSFIGNDILTERFHDLAHPNFPAEKISIKFRGHPSDFAKLLDELEHLTVYLCKDQQVLANAEVPLSGIFGENVPQPHFMEKVFALQPSQSDRTVRDSGAGHQASIGVSIGVTSSDKATGSWMSTAPVAQSGASSPWRAPSPAAPPPKPPVQQATDGILADLDQQSRVAKLADWHQYRFSIDLRSVRDLPMRTANIYLRYSYSPFGTSGPVSTYPPVEVNRGSEALLPHSFCAFEFVMSPDRLKTYLDAVPLLVEVWSTDAFMNDMQVGMASVRLGEVLSQPVKLVDEFGVPKSEKTHRGNEKGVGIRLQSHDSHVMIIAEGDDGRWRKVGETRVVLALEDFGVVEEQVKGTHKEIQEKKIDRDSKTAKDTMTPTTKDFVAKRLLLDESIVTSPNVTSNITTEPALTEGIRETDEYRTAVELEIWKQEEENRFRKQLQKREAQLLAQMADEWQRRETERSETHGRKTEELANLEERTRTLLSELEIRERRLVDGEESLQKRRLDLDEDHSRRVSEAKDAARRLHEEYTHKFELERARTAEAERLRSAAEEEQKRWTGRCRDLETEFAEFRKTLASGSEAALRESVTRERELRLEAERKLEDVVRSKKHYKAQWARALQEYARLQKRQQAETEQRLQRDHRELDHMRLRYRAKEEQELMASDRKILENVRQELQELKTTEKIQTKKTVRDIEDGIKHIDEQSKASLPNNTYNVYDAVDPKLSAELRRLENEKDTLLRSGVYTLKDRLVQDLDSRIRHVQTELSASQVSDIINGRTGLPTMPRNVVR